MLHQNSSSHVLAPTCVALQVRWGPNNPGSSLLVLSFSWMKLSDRPMAPWAFPAAKEQIQEDLGAFISWPLPLEAGGATCSGQSLYLAQSSPVRRHSRFQESGTKAGHGLTLYFHTFPPIIPAKAPCAMCVALAANQLS